jgi:hypothetical protein
VTDVSVGPAEIAIICVILAIFIGVIAVGVAAVVAMTRKKNEN